VPEGDTIYRTAAALRTAMIGKTMVRFEASRLVGPVPRESAVVEEVRSHGKHLEIVWDDGIVLHTHMRMTGSWHLYRHGEKWRKPVHRARVVIDVGDWVAVCFSAPVVETYRDFDPRRHPILGTLGPDLCRPDADLVECVRRMHTYEPQDTALAEVLLDQRVLCGVGNVYRCELLWACELNPWARVGELSRDECRAGGSRCTDVRGRSVRGAAISCASRTTARPIASCTGARVVRRCTRPRSSRRAGSLTTRRPTGIPPRGCSPVRTNTSRRNAPVDRRATVEYSAAAETARRLIAARRLTPGACGQSAQFDAIAVTTSTFVARHAG
jgi:endonuclease-8